MATEAIKLNPITANSRFVPATDKGKGRCLAAAPGTQINFLWIIAAIREGEDRQYGVVNVQPEFSAGRSGLDAVAGK